MAINFPSTPAANDTYSFAGRTWVYDGSGWQMQQANISFSTIVNALGYTPLSVGGGTISGNLVLTTGGLNANGSYGTQNQVLSSNGTGTYWATPLYVYYANDSIAYP